MAVGLYGKAGDRVGTVKGGLGFNLGLQSNGEGRHIWPVVPYGSFAKPKVSHTNRGTGISASAAVGAEATLYGNSQECPMQVKSKAVRIGRWLAVIVGITLLTYVVGYVASLNSDAYKTNLNFIRQSKLVQERLGAVSTVSLRPFGYELEFSGSSGVAEFESTVVGSQQTAVAVVALEKSAGSWRVTAAKLKTPLEEMRLTP